MKEQPAGEDGAKKPAQPFLLHRELSAWTGLDWSGQAERVAGADCLDFDLRNDDTGTIQVINKVARSDGEGSE